jgi:hypothetical protein
VVPLAISIPNSAVFAAKSTLLFRIVPVVNPTIANIFFIADAMGGVMFESAVPDNVSKLIPINENVNKTSKTIIIVFLLLNGLGVFSNPGRVGILFIWLVVSILYSTIDYRQIYNIITD